jgi:PAS domain-containing protein
MEIQFRCKNGAERIGLGSGELIEIEMNGASSPLSDITERKQPQEPLQVSEERYRQLVNSSSDWVWEVDADAVYT